jgi:hypothetical protein
VKSRVTRPGEADAGGAGRVAVRSRTRSTRSRRSIHHVGAASFAELEDEMTTWTPEDESPNRMDALVWAAHGDEAPGRMYEESFRPGIGIRLVRPPSLLR